MKFKALKFKAFSILSVFVFFYVFSNFYFIPMDTAINAGAVSVSDKRLVVGGETVGIKLYSEGIVCIGLQNIDGRCPAREAGLRQGDVIYSANGVLLNDSEDFAKAIEGVNGSISIVYMRGKDTISTKIQPIRDSEGKTRIGLWVRDSVAGVGTITFYDKESDRVVSLGHAVTDSDTGQIFKVRNGYITDCQIVSIKKGQSGNPGEIQGRFLPDEHIYGYLTKNTSSGLFANSSGCTKIDGQEYPVAEPAEIKEGPAKILTDLAGNGVEEYDIVIRRVYYKSCIAGSDLLIELTDKRLLDLTGGIIQGMSGCPIIQDGKLVGAVTHVFVNDPKRGYGIFISSILNEIGNN
ncbi:MAG: SpoIVB peptidase [Bacillota bacterium]|nr:SpoIVB peptidase [Bacillota bacterium]